MDINQHAQQCDLDEAFEAGRQALSSYLGVEFSVNSPAELPKAEQALATDAQYLAAFWFAYFTARLKIERTYELSFANQLYQWGKAQLAKIQNADYLPDASEQLRTEIAVRLVDADRGMHNNDFVHTQKTCQQILTMIDAHDQTGLTMERIYLQAILALTNLLVRRDAGDTVLEADWHEVETILQHAVQQTASLKIYSSVLHTYLTSVAYLKRVEPNKLLVADGCLVTTYYATINSMQVDDLIAALDTPSQRESLMTRIGASAFYEPEAPDVLSDLSEEGQFHIWQFDLPGIHLDDFRGATRDYQVSLRFNTLGLVQLQLETELQEVDVNTVRHLTNMALENALDEPIHWSGKIYPYLRDVADKVFGSVDTWLGDGDSLIYNVSMHVNNCVLVEQAVLQKAPQTYLRSHVVRAHADWAGLTIPPREVRSAFENWRVQTPHSGIKNVGSDLYHSEDWVQADGSYALILQTEQPSWVTEQALENVQVATGAKYYMQQLGKMLFDNVRRIQLDYHDDEDVDSKTRYELREQEKVYRDRVKQLHLLNMEVRDLLHLMDTGGLMRFPDHGRFVQQLFDAVGVTNERESLQQTMQESQDTTRMLRVQISTALEKLSQKSSQRFDAVVGFMGILLSVTAFSDMFDLIEETGTDIPALVEMEVVFGAMILIVLYFSIEAIIRRFK